MVLRGLVGSLLVLCEVFFFFSFLSMVVWSLRIGMFNSKFPYISRNGHDTLDVFHLFTTVFLALMPVQSSLPQ